MKLTELENSIKVCILIALMIVTLEQSTLVSHDTPNLAEGMLLQYSQGKHGHDSQFPRHRKLQGPERLEWEAQDDEIENDIKSGADPGLGIDIVAPTYGVIVQLQPEVADRLALERGGQEKGQSISDDEPDYDKDGHSEALLGKDAEHE